jgi:hypothetical protein
MSVTGCSLCMLATYLAVRLCMFVTYLAVRLCVFVTYLAVRLCMFVTYLAVRLCVFVTYLAVRLCVFVTYLAVRLCSSPARPSSVSVGLERNNESCRGPVCLACPVWVVLFRGIKMFHQSFVTYPIHFNIVSSLSV